MPSNTYRITSGAAIGLLAAALSGCSSHGRVVVEGDDGKVIVEMPGDDVDEQAPDVGGHPGKGKGHAKGRYQSHLPKIPPGHMPPPGKCRIWFPDRPPGQQPPPGNCEELEHCVPPGAWLISG